MISKLKLLIDNAENMPAIKKILLDIAALPESQQEDAMILVHALVNSLTAKDVQK